MMITFENFYPKFQTLIWTLIVYPHPSNMEKKFESPHSPLLPPSSLIRFGKLAFISKNVMALNQKIEKDTNSHLIQLISKCQSINPKPKSIDRHKKTHSNLFKEINKPKNSNQFTIFTPLPCQFSLKCSPEKSLIYSFFHPIWRPFSNETSNINCDTESPLKINLLN